MIGGMICVLSSCVEMMLKVRKEIGSEIYFKTAVMDAGKIFQRGR